MLLHAPDLSPISLSGDPEMTCSTGIIDTQTEGVRISWNNGGHHYLTQINLQELQTLQKLPLWPSCDVSCNYFSQKVMSFHLP